MRWLWLWLLLLTACARQKPAGPVEAPCESCHAAEFAAWAGSHHALGQAIAPADSGARFTIGVEPLVQHVVEAADGRLQIAPRGFVDGGVLHLANEVADWRSPAFNWNGSCAPCHATGFIVGAGDGGVPRSTWRALNVSCEACHGEAQGHRSWLASGKPMGTPGHGFARSLSNTRNDFRFPADGGAIARAVELKPDLELDVCGGCHSRRRALTDDGALSGALLDRFEPALLEPGLYTPEGVAVDEVFELGSFLMSPMNAAGVRCTDCHEPHGGHLRARGDALCAKCHRLEAFAPHAKGQACIDCHMPKTTFLAVNERRDHFFHGAQKFSLSGDVAAVAADVKLSSFIRGSAVARLTDADALKPYVASSEPWLRYGAATALRGVPPASRRVGAPLLEDPLRAVRVRAARALFGVVPVPPRAAGDFETAERANAFRGEAWFNLAMSAQQRGEVAQAEAHLRHALRVEPAFAPAVINLADLLRASGREGEGRALLEEALKQPGPFRCALAYALGLARWRVKDKAGALEAFRVAREDGDPLHVRAYELALEGAR